MFMNHYNKYQAKSSLSLSIGLALALSLSACQPTDNNPGATDNQQTDNSTQANNANADTNTSMSITTQIEFPQYIKGWPTLLHPISPLSLTAEQSDSTSSIKSRDSWQPTVFEQISPYTYQAHVSNIVFENLVTGANQKLLTNDKFVIHQLFIPYITKKSITTNNGDIAAADTDAVMVEGNAILEADTVNESEPLEDNSDTNRKQHRTVTTLFKHVIYHINETPYKEDEKNKNLFKQQSLYMSDNMGRQPIKLHPDAEFVQTTKWLPQLSRYYFITQSDSDDNGIIDDKDDTHNYQIDFSKDVPVAKGYDFEK